jgi:hypothetical protein
MLGGYLLLHDRNEPAVEAAMDAVAASGEWEHIATANLMVAYKRIAPPTVVIAPEVKKPARKGGKK